MKVGIHVAVGIQDILAQPGRTPCPNAVQLGTEESALASHLVAGGTVGSEERLAPVKIGAGFCKGGCSLRDELVEPGALLLGDGRRSRRRSRRKEGSQAIAQVDGGADQEQAGEFLQEFTVNPGRSK